MRTVCVCIALLVFGTCGVVFGIDVIDSRRGECRCVACEEV